MDFHTIRFILVAAALYGLFHFAYHKVPDSTLREQVYPTIIGEPAEKVIKLITPDRRVRVDDNRILSSKASLNIVRGCDGSGVWFMLLAAVLGFGATFRQTLIGLLLGTLTVYVINQVRIVGLFYLVEWNRMLFPAVHTYYAPTLIVFLIAGFFLWWTRWTIKDSDRTDTRVSSGHIFLATATRAFVAWAVLSVAGQLWGERLIHTLIPYYEVVAEQANPDFHAQIRIEHDALKQDTNIINAATALRAQPITPDRSMPAGNTVEASITVKHALVPLIILAAICLSFPVAHIRQRVALLLALVPAVLFVSALTAPIQLLGNLEIGFLNAAAAAGYSRESTWILDWMLLTEGGGRWLIPILTGIGCAAAVRRLVK